MVLQTELDKRDYHLTLLLLPGLETIFFTFTMLWMCLVQKWSVFGRGKIFYKLQRMSGHTVLRKTIKLCATLEGKHNG